MIEELFDETFGAMDIDPESFAIDHERLVKFELGEATIPLVHYNAEGRIDCDLTVTMRISYDKFYPEED